MWPRNRSPAFELLQIGDVWLVVLCSSSDDDAPRLQNAAILQRELVWPLISVDLDHTLSHPHLRAEFFCLDNSAARKIQAGDAHRKANVVLYL